MNTVVDDLIELRTNKRSTPHSFAQKIDAQAQLLFMTNTLSFDALPLTSLHAPLLQALQKKNVMEESNASSMCHSVMSHYH